MGLLHSVWAHWVKSEPSRHMILNPSNPWYPCWGTGFRWGTNVKPVPQPQANLCTYPRVSHTHGNPYVHMKLIITTVNLLFVLFSIILSPSIITLLPLPLSYLLSLWYPFMGITFPFVMAHDYYLWVTLSMTDQHPTTLSCLPTNWEWVYIPICTIFYLPVIVVSPLQ